MKQIIFLSIILTFLSCFINAQESLKTESMNVSITPRLVGAMDAEIIFFPYVASLRDRNGNYFCTASSITDRDFLTAGHCFTNSANVEYPYTDVTVHTGTNNLNEIGNKHRIKMVLVHPGWTMSREIAYAHDIAHIRVKRRMRESDTQKPINRPTEAVVSYQTGTLTGWGSIDPNSQEAHKILQQLDMYSLRYDDCQQYFPDDMRLQKEQLCAYQSPGQGCHTGDSGAPYVIDDKIVGIVSWIRNGGCANGEPEIYSSVCGEKDFIDLAIAQANYYE